MKFSDISMDMIDFTPDGFIKIGDDRFILTSAESLGNLRKQLIGTIGKRLAMGVLMRYGYASGYRDALDLKKKYDWDSEEDWMKAGPMLHSIEGVARVRTKKLTFDREAGLFYMEGIWTDSYEALEHKKYFGESDEPVCWTLMGYASGYCSAFLGHEAICLERSCEAMGDNICSFTVKTRDQWGSEADEIIEALKPTTIGEDLSYMEKLIRDKTAALEEYSKGLEAMVQNRTRELTREKELARSIIETSNVFIVATDVRGRITLFNRGAQMISGYDKDEVLGKDFYELFHPAEPSKKREEYVELMIKNAYPRTVDEPIKIKNDGERTISWTETALRNEYGSVIGVIRFGMDVTLRKQLEKELIESRNEAELYLDLLAHDVNNMNQVSLGNLEMTEIKLQDASEDIIGPIRQAIDAIAKSSSLIDNVKKLQRIKYFEEAFSRVDLNDAILESIKYYKKIANKKVEINYEPAPGSYILATPLIGEIFANLLDNSVKYSRDEVTIWIRVEKIKSGKKDCYRIIYEDDGTGIDDDFKKRLFYIFKRGSRKGLGLHIVKNLVEKYGGEIRVDDRVPGDYKKGAKFLITLPAADQNKLRH
ncbi:XylR N-terminal domain-containing protein [Methanooceanicella nereidis]|nr:XylR N-terminal domain-containing protein [Methanocella sp. CWC-04]